MRLTFENKTKAKNLLTTEINKYFKILFDYKVEDDYKISTIDTVQHPDRNRLFFSKEKAILRKALLDFIEDATNKTYTEIKSEYGRERDKNDIAVDSEFDNEEFPIDHYSLSQKGLASKARIHGYIREGVFVVRRIDWGHNFHKKTLHRNSQQ